MKKIIGIMLLLFICSVLGTEVFLDGENNFISLTNSSNLDSAYIIFYYQNTGNQVDSVMLKPYPTTPALTVVADSFSLDTLGSYLAKIVYYANADGGSITGTFCEAVINSDGINPSGGGPNSVTLYVEDDDDDMIANIIVHIQSEGGSLDYDLDTDTDGKVVFSLVDGTYLTWIGGTALYTQDAIPETVTVSGATTDTIAVTEENIATGRCKVWANVYDFLGDTLAGAVLRATPKNMGKNWTLVEDSSPIMLSIEEDIADANGLVELTPWKSGAVTNVSGDSLEYTFELLLPRHQDLRVRNYSVPDSTEHKIIWKKL